MEAAVTAMGAATAAETVAETAAETAAGMAVGTAAATETASRPPTRRIRILGISSKSHRIGRRLARRMTIATLTR
jgi:hypothetical protein